jgi:hypothetical protein
VKKRKYKQKLHCDRLCVILIFTKSNTGKDDDDDGGGGEDEEEDLRFPHSEDSCCDLHG